MRPTPSLWQVQGTSYILVNPGIVRPKFEQSSYSWGTSQVVLLVKNPPANAGDLRDGGSILGLGRSPGGGHGNPLQYSCLENPVDRGPWLATVHSVTYSQIGLKRLSTHEHCSWGTKETGGFGMFCVHACVLGYFSHVRFFATLWTAARQAPLFYMRLQGSMNKVLVISASSIRYL